MNTEFTAKASITIDVPISKVWDSLIDPKSIKQYMFGTDVVSDWKEGSLIIWHGSWEGKPYEDKGVILKIVPEKILQVSHYSALSGVPDVPENYHILTYELTSLGDKTIVSLSQDNNSNKEEQEHSQQMWEGMLQALKKFLEK
jgi:uncharacterized protein YndB with AHSA1/START domain